MVKLDEYEAFLEQVRTGYPDHGEVAWDGQTRQTVISVKFERPDRVEPETMVRERAWRYLRQLTPLERAGVRIRVMCRDEKPIRALIESQDGFTLSPGRLRELQRILGEP